MYSDTTEDLVAAAQTVLNVWDGGAMVIEPIGREFLAAEPVDEEPTAAEQIAGRTCSRRTCSRENH